MEGESPINEAILILLSTVIAAINAKFLKIATSIAIDMNQGGRTYDGLPN